VFKQTRPTVVKSKKGGGKEKWARMNASLFFSLTSHILLLTPHFSLVRKTPLADFFNIPINESGNVCSTPSSTLSPD
jgi:hypothetical protein